MKGKNITTITKLSSTKEGNNYPKFSCNSKVNQRRFLLKILLNPQCLKKTRGKELSHDSALITSAVVM